MNREQLLEVFWKEIAPHYSRLFPTFLSENEKIELAKDHLNQLQLDSRKIRFSLHPNEGFFLSWVMIRSRSSPLFFSSPA